MEFKGRAAAKCHPLRHGGGGGGATACCIESNGRAPAASRPQLQALQEGVHGRLVTQEGAISVIGAGLEGVRQRAEIQAKEFGRMQAAVRGDWQRAEEWIKGEIDRRMDQMGQRLS